MVVPDIDQNVYLSTQPNLGFVPNQTVVIYSDSDYSGYYYNDGDSTQLFYGFVDSYDPITGTISVVTTTSRGVGSTSSFWYIALSGEVGPQGPIGSTGSKGVSSLYYGTSSTYIAIPEIGGLITLYTQLDLSFTNGQSVIITHDVADFWFDEEYTDDSGYGYFQGFIDSYDSNSGELVIITQYSELPGTTYSFWYINLSGEIGSQGPVGPSYVGTSSTYLAVPDVDQNVYLSTQPNLGFIPSQTVIVYNDIDAYVDYYYEDDGTTGLFYGFVDSYDPISGTLSLVSTLSRNIGVTSSFWYIALSGEVGPIGIGSTGPQGKSSLYYGTSSTYLAVPDFGTIVNLYTQLDLSFTSGQSVIITHDLNSLYIDDDYDEEYSTYGYFQGVIESYDPNTGQLYVFTQYTYMTGSTYSFWYINLAGGPGLTGRIIFDEQNIYGTEYNTNINVITEGESGVELSNDKKGWALNFGHEYNNITPIGSVSTVSDSDGNTYTVGVYGIVPTGFIMKTNPDGTNAWTYGTNEWAYGVAYNSGNVFVLTSESGTIKIMKLDTDGNLIDQWIIDNALIINSFGEMTVDEFSNIYLVATNNDLDIITIKIDNTGSIAWSNVTDSGNDDSGCSIKYKNGFIYTSGIIYNPSTTLSDITVSKMDTDGNLIWNETIEITDVVSFSGPFGTRPFPFILDGSPLSYNITVDDDGNVYVCGYIYNLSTNICPFYYKMRSDGGTIDWISSLSLSEVYYITSIEYNSIDGNLYLLEVNPVGPELIKINPADGTILDDFNFSSNGISHVDGRVYPSFSFGRIGISSDLLFMSGFTRLTSKKSDNILFESRFNGILLAFDFINGVVKDEFYGWQISTANPSKDLTSITADLYLSLGVSTYSQTTSSPADSYPIIESYSIDYYSLSPLSQPFVLKVDGEIQIKCTNKSEKYTLPTQTGYPNDVLTYPFRDYGNKRHGDLLEWRSLSVDTFDQLDISNESMDFDFTTGITTWYIDSVSLGDNFNVNFIKMPVFDSRAISITLVISQGSNAYLPLDITIEGNSYPIKWANGSIPSGNPNQVDIVGFTFMRYGSDWVNVLAQFSTYV